MFTPAEAADFLASAAIYGLGLIGLVGCLLKAIQMLAAQPPRSGRGRGQHYSLN